MTYEEEERLSLAKIDKMLPDPSDKDSMVLTLLGAGMALVEEFIDPRDIQGFAKLPEMTRYAVVLLIGNFQTILGPIDKIQKLDLVKEHGPISKGAEEGLKVKIRRLVDLISKAQQSLDNPDVKNGA
jgi:hypothetical protein